MYTPYRSSSRTALLWIRRSTIANRTATATPAWNTQNYNSSKGTYFKGGYDADGNYFDID